MASSPDLSYSFAGPLLPPLPSCSLFTSGNHVILEEYKPECVIIGTLQRLPFLLSAKATVLVTVSKALQDRPVCPLNRLIFRALLAPLHPPGLLCSSSSLPNVLPPGEAPPSPPRCYPRLLLPLPCSAQFKMGTILPNSICTSLIYLSLYSL